ncbi:MAG: hypothetical protein AAF357_19770, partial [Verrucomicrobiota bacterium]
KNFSLPPDVDPDKVTLLVNYDDAFIAYLNGEELFRENFKTNPETGKIEAGSHEAEGYERFSLAAYARHFRPGGINTIALRGFNVKAGSSDLSLDPWLVELK